MSIKVEAWDSDGFLVKVEFFANGEKIGEDVDGRDGWAFQWRDSPDGEYEFVARAIDNDGAATDSAPVHVRISSEPPRR